MNPIDQLLQLAGGAALKLLAPALCFVSTAFGLGFAWRERSFQQRTFTLLVLVLSLILQLGAAVTAWKLDQPELASKLWNAALFGLVTAFVFACSGRKQLIAVFLGSALILGGLGPWLADRLMGTVRIGPW